MTKSKIFWNSLLSTLWFVPMGLAVCGILLGIVLAGADFFLADWLKFLPSFFTVQASGARDMLAVIAGSTITVAGTVFSITIVALTLASTQFSPRILRNFMRDQVSQIILGILVGIFAYCIVVLRTIRETENDVFVPITAVFVGVLLGFVGIGCLVFFIHHVATSIQATNIVSTIAEETIREIRRTFPLKAASTNVIDEKLQSRLEQNDFLTVYAGINGYVQNVDFSKLMLLAEKYDLVLKIQRRIGQFTIEHLPVLYIYPNQNDFRLTPQIENEMRDTYDIGTYRTVEGDAAFGLRQIVDIALKALSPAINDSTTGVTCVDYLTAIMGCLAKRPSCPQQLFAGGKLRVIVEQQRFEDFFDLAFNQIRQSAGGNVAVILRQLNSINILSKINLELADEAERRERHDLMETQARLLYELAKRTIEADSDLQIIERYYERVSQSLVERQAEIV